MSFLAGNDLMAIWLKPGCLPALGNGVELLLDYAYFMACRLRASQMKGNMMSASSERPTVLIVDDEPFNLSLMDGILSKQYNVQLADNGSKALELAFATPPDLILLDVMMPGMDGFEVCRRLMDNPATSHIPVIFITASNEIRDEELGFSVGASDFIHKPISAPIVAARVKAHLKIKFMQDYLRHENTQAVMRSYFWLRMACNSGS